jgi:hypothetical protein
MDNVGADCVEGYAFRGEVATVCAGEANNAAVASLLALRLVGDRFVSLLLRCCVYRESGDAVESADTCHCNYCFCLSNCMQEK